jgi:hypothetical protein
LRNFALHLLGGVQEFGHVRALSLRLRVLDLEGTQIAFRSAGIEAIVKLSATSEGDTLPEEQWLTTTERLGSSICSALGDHGERLRQPRPGKASES